MRIRTLVTLGLGPILAFAGPLVAQTPLDAAVSRDGDLRELYDVQAYRLDLGVDPDTETLSGTVAVEATVVGEGMDTLQLDMKQVLEPSRVRLVREPLSSTSDLDGAPLEFSHEGEKLFCKLPALQAAGSTVRVAVTYIGKPTGRGFSGFHWERTPDGKPWIGTSCQGPGAHLWWPCKASFFHPEDKPERLFVNLDVPQGLYGVSNGRLLAREPAGTGRERFRWQHDYPLETYAVTLNVAPYVVVEQELELEGIDAPVPFVYYVLPQDKEKADLQFRDVPEMLAIYSRAFGPFPFPKSKFALVETSFWGMEHSTAVAYGSSFPKWCEANGARDRYASRNRFFDYILVHESAHEWWGNAVSAKAWGHFWIHEGFGTYAEGVYVEFSQGREAADRYFASIERMASSGRLYRGKDVNSGQAYSATIYYRGAWVLETLRHYVADDELWWKTLRDFNMEHRYRNATTEDFRAVLERNTGKAWQQFFDEWFYGDGAPRLNGAVAIEGHTIKVEVENRGRGDGFHVPLDLAWQEGGTAKSTRLMLDPGSNELGIQCDAAPTDLRVVGLHRVLGRHDVQVR